MQKTMTIQPTKWKFTNFTIFKPQFSTYMHYQVDALLKSTIQSVKMNFFVAPKMLASCSTRVCDAVAVGRNDAGREGTLSGWNSFLPKDSPYSVNTAWQKMNLQIQTELSPHEQYQIV